MRSLLLPGLLALSACAGAPKASNTEEASEFKVTVNDHEAERKSLIENVRSAHRDYFISFFNDDRGRPRQRTAWDVYGPSRLSPGRPYLYYTVRSDLPIKDGELPCETGWVAALLGVSGRQPQNLLFVAVQAERGAENDAVTLFPITPVTVEDGSDEKSENHPDIPATPIFLVAKNGSVCDYKIAGDWSSGVVDIADSNRATRFSIQFADVNGFSRNRFASLRLAIRALMPDGGALDIVSFKLLDLLAEKYSSKVSADIAFQFRYNEAEDDDAIRIGLDQASILIEPEFIPSLFLQDCPLDFYRMFECSARDFDLSRAFKPSDLPGSELLGDVHASLKELAEALSTDYQREIRDDRPFMVRWWKPRQYLEQRKKRYAEGALTAECRRLSNEEPSAPLNRLNDLDRLVARMHLLEAAVDYFEDPILRNNAACFSEQERRLLAFANNAFDRRTPSEFKEDAFNAWFNLLSEALQYPTILAAEVYGKANSSQNAQSPIRKLSIDPVVKQILEKLRVPQSHEIFSIELPVWERLAKLQASGRAFCKIQVRGDQTEPASLLTTFLFWQPFDLSFTRGAAGEADDNIALPILVELDPSGRFINELSITTPERAWERAGWTPIEGEYRAWFNGLECLNGAAGEDRKRRMARFFDATPVGSARAMREDRQTQEHDTVDGRPKPVLTGGESADRH